MAYIWKQNLWKITIPTVQISNVNQSGKNFTKIVHRETPETPGCATYACGKGCSQFSPIMCNIGGTTCKARSCTHHASARWSNEARALRLGLLSCRLDSGQTQFRLGQLQFKLGLGRADNLGPVRKVCFNLVCSIWSGWFYQIHGSGSWAAPVRWNLMGWTFIGFE